MLDTSKAYLDFRLLQRHLSRKKVGVKYHGAWRCVCVCVGGGGGGGGQSQIINRQH